MIEKDAAMDLARAHLAKLVPSNDKEIVLLENQTIEKSFGWVFFYNTKEYIENGDFRDALLGNAPLIVNRHDGSVHETGTGEPVEFYIEEYERQRNQ
jgi:immunity protein 35 of polymorphic toxin system